MREKTNEVQEVKLVKQNGQLSPEELRKRRLRQFEKSEEESNSAASLSADARAGNNNLGKNSDEVQEEKPVNPEGQLSLEELRRHRLIRFGKSEAEPHNAASSSAHAHSGSNYLNNDKNRVEVVTKTGSTDDNFRQIDMPLALISADVENESGDVKNESGDVQYEPDKANFRVFPDELITNIFIELADTSDFKESLRSYMRLMSASRRMRRIGSDVITFKWFLKKFQTAKQVQPTVFELASTYTEKELYDHVFYRNIILCYFSHLNGGLHGDANDAFIPLYVDFVREADTYMPVIHRRLIFPQNIEFDFYKVGVSLLGMLQNIPEENVVSSARRELVDGPISCDTYVNISATLDSMEKLYLSDMLSLRHFDDFFCIRLKSQSTGFYISQHLQDLSGLLERRHMLLEANAEQFQSELLFFLNLELIQLFGKCVGELSTVSKGLIANRLKISLLALRELYVSSLKYLSASSFSLYTMSANNFASQIISLGVNQYSSILIDANQSYVQLIGKELSQLLDSDNVSIMLRYFFPNINELMIFVGNLTSESIGFILNEIGDGYLFGYALRERGANAINELGMLRSYTSQAFFTDFFRQSINAEIKANPGFKAEVFFAGLVNNDILLIRKLFAFLPLALVRAVIATLGGHKKIISASTNGLVLWLRYVAPALEQDPFDILRGLGHRFICNYITIGENNIDLLCAMSGMEETHMQDTIPVGNANFQKEYLCFLTNTVVLQTLSTASLLIQYFTHILPGNYRWFLEEFVGKEYVLSQLKSMTVSSQAEQDSIYYVNQLLRSCTTSDDATWLLDSYLGKSFIRSLLVAMPPSDGDMSRIQISNYIINNVDRLTAEVNFVFQKYAHDNEHSITIKQWLLLSVLDIKDLNAILVTVKHVQWLFRMFDMYSTIMSRDLTKEDFVIPDSNKKTGGMLLLDRLLEYNPHVFRNIVTETSVCVLPELLLYLPISYYSRIVQSLSAEQKLAFPNMIASITQLARPQISSFHGHVDTNIAWRMVAMLLLTTRKMVTFTDDHKMIFTVLNKIDRALRVALIARYRNEILHAVFDFQPLMVAIPNRKAEYDAYCNVLDYVMNENHYTRSWLQSLKTMLFSRLLNLTITDSSSLTHYLRKLIGTDSSEMQSISGLSVTDTLIFFALHFKYIDVVVGLIAQGDDASKCNKKGHTLLSLAKRMKDFNHVFRLLSGGANKVELCTFYLDSGDYYKAFGLLEQNDSAEFKIAILEKLLYYSQRRRDELSISARDRFISIAPDDGVSDHMKDYQKWDGRVSSLMEAIEKLSNKLVSNHEGTNGPNSRITISSPCRSYG